MLRAAKLTGQTFGRLTILKSNGTNKHGKKTWLCKCLCGNEITTTTGGLKSGKTKSCGCLRSEQSKQANTTHGMSNSSEFRIWYGIKDRCNRPANTSYRNYGKRGIRCFWNTFDEFYRDMGKRPSPDHSIERTDNNGHYCKENCCWATSFQQSRNTRKNVIVIINKERMILKDAAIKLNANYDLAKQRIRNGCDPYIALTSPSRNKRHYAERSPRDNK